MINRILHSGLIGLFAYLLIGLFLPTANGQTMSNSSYTIKMGNINTAAGDSSNSSSKLSITIGQTIPGLYSGTNFQVKAGFQYVRPDNTFIFTLSQTIIDFGSLYPTTPVIRTANLTIKKGSILGYSITASEDHPMEESASKTAIPDTTCDNGSCSEFIPALWTNTLTYGFGYRCDNVTGTDCSTDFVQEDFYKQFSDDSEGEEAQVIMASTTTGRDKKAQISYKVNVSGTQPPGSYANTITYIATPTF